MSSRLRIGMTCYPTFGGSGVIATEIGLSMAKRGHRVHFICYEVPFRLDGFFENVFFHAVEVRDYPLFDHSPYPLALASKMVEGRTFERLDLLQVHYAFPHATRAYVARQILGASAPKVITALHGTDITVVGSDSSFLPITRFSIAQSDGVTVPSEYLRRATYEKLYVPPAVPIEVIPNFVDTDRFKPAASKGWDHLPRLFPALNGSARGTIRPKVLIHNSNFRPLKRVEDVVRVFAGVREHLPCLLALVGAGPGRSGIWGMGHSMGLTEWVCFLGAQLHFLEVLENSDVFLLPSETASFDLPPLEPTISGLPLLPPLF